MLWRFKLQTKRGKYADKKLVLSIFFHKLFPLNRKKKKLRIILFTRQVFFPKVLVMYFIGGLAFFFYLSKFPEKFFPGE